MKRAETGELRLGDDYISNFSKLREIIIDSLNNCHPVFESYTSSHNERFDWANNVYFMEMENEGVDFYVCMAQRIVFRITCSKKDFYNFNKLKEYLRIYVSNLIDKDLHKGFAKEFLAYLKKSLD